MQDLHGVSTGRPRTRMIEASLRLLAVPKAAGATLLRPGRLRRLIDAATLPGGIPPGRSRPELPGPRR
jgi:hypothetical protein